MTESFSNILLFCFIEIQYSLRHSEKNHCDRRIIVLSDLDISF
jgi:hypothetical protein